MPDEEVKPETEVVTEAEKPEAEKPEAEAAEVEALPEQEDWRDKELRRKHAQIKEKERKLAEKEQEAADLRLMLERRNSEGADTGGSSAKPAAQAQLTREEVKREAQVLRDQERYSEQLTNTNAAGEKAYGVEWGKALDRLTQFGTVDQADMTAILNTDNGAKVLYELGKNPAEYQRILDLPPARRLNEFVKISMRENPKPKISQAPAPTDPIKPRATPQPGLRDDMQDDDWFAQRRKDKRTRFEQQQGR